MQPASQKRKPALKAPKLSTRSQEEEIEEGEEDEQEEKDEMETEKEEEQEEEEDGLEDKKEDGKPGWILLFITGKRFTDTICQRKVSAD